MFLIRAGSIEGFEQLLAQFGVNLIELLSDTGISQVQLRNPNSYVSYSELAQLLEKAAEACNEPLFGALLSRRQTSAILGDIGTTLIQQPTLGDALIAVEKYLYLHARGAHLTQHFEGDDLRLEMNINVGEPVVIDQLMQMSLGQLENFIHESLEAEAQLAWMLRQKKPANCSPSLASHIEFSAAIDGVRFPAKWLSRRPRRDDATLQKHFENYLTLLQQRYPDDLGDQVREIIGQLLSSGESSIDQVAATLNMHPRILQKKLQQQGTSYSQLKQGARLEIARQHLSSQSMSVTDLALNLGYAEVSVFSRNFKKWTGLSPRDWQRSLEKN